MEPASSGSTIIDAIISKYLQHGYQSLSLNDVAVLMVEPQYQMEFQTCTGVNWEHDFKPKAVDKLNNARYDLGWLMYKTPDAYAPLFQAAERGDLPRLSKLVNKFKNDPKLRLATNNQKKSPLHIAAINGNMSLVDYLIFQGFPTNSHDKQLRTPLLYAARHGHLEVYQFLLEHGADLDAIDIHNRNALHNAVLSDSPTIVQDILQRRPTQLFSKDYFGFQPIHYWIWNTSKNWIEIGKQLLMNCADINAQDSEGKTPLHHAAKEGKKRYIPFLIQNGASNEILDFIQKKTPFEMALNDQVAELITGYQDQANVQNMQNEFKKTSLLVGRRILQNGQLPKITQSKQLTAPIIDEPQNKDWKITNWIRDQFYTIMKEIQKQGVYAGQHIRRPYLFTGSWMQGLYSPKDLHDHIKDLSASDALMRCFNILCPYDGQLPSVMQFGKTDTVIGSAWYEKQIETDSQAEVEPGLSLVEQLELKLGQLESQYQQQTAVLEDMEKQLISLKIELNDEKDEKMRIEAQLQVYAEAQITQENNQEENVQEINVSQNNMQKDEMSGKTDQITDQQSLQKFITEALQIVDNLGIQINDLECENAETIKGYVEQLRTALATAENNLSNGMGHKAAKEEIQLPGETTNHIPVDSLMELYTKLETQSTTLLDCLPKSEEMTDNQLSKDQVIAIFINLEMGSETNEILCQYLNVDQDDSTIDSTDFLFKLEEDEAITQGFSQKLTSLFGMELSKISSKPKEFYHTLKFFAESERTSSDWLLILEEAKAHGRIKNEEDIREQGVELESPINDNEEQKDQELTGANSIVNEEEEPSKRNEDIDDQEEQKSEEAVEPIPNNEDQQEIEEQNPLNAQPEDEAKEQSQELVHSNAENETNGNEQEEIDNEADDQLNEQEEDDQDQGSVEQVPEAPEMEPEISEIKEVEADSQRFDDENIKEFLAQEDEGNEQNE